MERPSVMEKINNRIYFYSEINRTDVLQLNRNIRETGSELLTMQKIWDIKEPINIYLHINSFGGSVSDTFSVIDEISRCPVPVVSVIDGIAASGATIISVSCTHRQINRHAVMLIHQLSSFMGGTFEQMKDDMHNSSLYMNMIKKVYSEKTKMPKDVLDDILKHDLFLDAEKCLEYGLVDEII
jgi:ATP-dependent Clp protease protease subunit